MKTPRFITRRMLAFVSASFLLLCATALNLPLVSANGDGWLQVSPSSGPPGTEVWVSVNVLRYVEQELEVDPKEYMGLEYKVVWDAGGWPEPFMSVGNILSRTTWKVIGEAKIGSIYLSGEATIPDVGSWEYGEHYIFVIYENIHDKYRVWWWTTFTVTEEYTLTVNIVGGGSVDVTPNQITYASGTEVTLTAVPMAGWEFSRWSGDLIGSSEHATIILYGDKTVTATFTQEDDDGDDDDGPWPCIIATAAYGSPLEREVVYMRHVRDDLIGSTEAGRILVGGWNSFYYLWSPPVARLIAKSNVLKSVFKVLLTPLLGTIHLAAQEYHCLAWLNPEIASITAFVTAAILSIAIYIASPILVIRIMIKYRHSLCRISKTKHK